MGVMSGGDVIRMVIAHLDPPEVPNDAVLIVALEEASATVMQVGEVSDLTPIESAILAATVAMDLPGGTTRIAGVLCNIREYGCQEKWREWVLAATGVGLGVSCYAVRDGAWACLMPDERCQCTVTAGEVVLDGAK